MKEKDMEIKFAQANLNEANKQISSMKSNMDNYKSEYYKWKTIAENLNKERSLRAVMGRTFKLASMMSKVGMIDNTKEAINKKAIELAELPDEEYFKKEKEVEGVAVKMPQKKEASFVKRFGKLRNDIICQGKEDHMLSLEKKQHASGNLQGIWTPGNKTTSRTNYGGDKE